MTLTLWSCRLLLWKARITGTDHCKFMWCWRQNLCKHIHTCPAPHIHICTYPHTCTYTHIYIHSPTHTHAHTHTTFYEVETTWYFKCMLRLYQMYQKLSIKHEINSALEGNGKEYCRCDWSIRKPSGLWLKIHEPEKKNTKCSTSLGTKRTNCAWQETSCLHPLLRLGKV